LNGCESLSSFLNTEKQINCSKPLADDILNTGFFQNKAFMHVIMGLSGLPILSEALYSSCADEIFMTLKLGQPLLEFILGVYLSGFALGVLFWGHLSDFFGRRPCILIGLGVFVVGCLGCCFAKNLSVLALSRFAQGVGSGMGSILSQVVLWDVFKGSLLGRAYAVMGGVVAIPVIGVILGSSLEMFWGWSSVFVLLSLCGAFLLVYVWTCLPETGFQEECGHFMTVIKKMGRDKTVLGLAIAGGICNSMGLSYGLERDLYLSNWFESLSISEWQSQGMLLVLAVAAVLGCWLSKKLHSFFSLKKILGFGIILAFLGTCVWSLFALIHCTVKSFPSWEMAAICLFSQIHIMIGVSMASCNIPPLALQQYQVTIGTASSIFGFLYALLTALFSLGMGLGFLKTHLTFMPLYSMALSILMGVLFWWVLVYKPTKN
jgi:MFS family permease